MNIKRHGINRSGYLGRKARARIFLRWFCFSLLVLFFYMIMCSGAFKTAQPVFVIPLAIAVAMHNREIGSAVFGVFCGFAVDMAYANLFGMSSVWLMPCCLAATLLVMNLIRVNVINHLWLSLLTCVIMGFMEYFFKYFIWDIQSSYIMLFNYILPSYGFTILLSPLVYFPVKFIFHKFKEKETRGVEESANIDEEKATGS